MVKPGDWIADVTYERNALTVYNPNTQTGRFLTRQPAGEPVSQSVQQQRVGQPAGPAVFLVPGAEGDCRRSTIRIPNNNPPLRSMVVYVDRSLQARTVLSSPGNAAGLQRRLDLALCGQRDSPAVR